ncbi:MAG: ABC transporter ATP-binding protein [Candidatus Heimdallarchaeota archaeon]
MRVGWHRSRIIQVKVVEYMKPSLLSIENLRVSYLLHNAEVRAVDDVSFQIREGEIVALVGESGSGKTTTAIAIPRLISPPAKIVGGRIFFKDTELVQAPDEVIQSIRGKEISMIFQDPASFLNPLHKVGNQIREAILLHEVGVTQKEAERRVIEILNLVRIADPERVYNYYPHQLSGGMSQRAIIAMAIAHYPSLLLADEPTTALDLTIQAQILHLLKTLNRELNLAILLITHDLGCVAGLTDKVIVMYAGHLVEEGPCLEIFKDPKHPYTKVLLAASSYAGETSTVELIKGSSPDLTNLPPGCPFHPRCSDARSQCKEQRPLKTQLTKDRWVTCWEYDNHNNSTAA